jgi:hypothetical protein
LRNFNKNYNYKQLTMKSLIRLLTLCTIAGFLFTACEGPAGPAGKDANESCTTCHNSTVVEIKAIEYEHALHFSGTAFEEGNRNACAPCHSHQGFKYVVKNSTPATFVADPVTAGKFLNSYQLDNASIALPGPISCFTCHSSLHSTYTDADFLPLTSVAAVPMTMYGGSKSINFAKTNANLCSKCHQPRPVTASSGNVIDYSVLSAAATKANTYTLSSLSYRTGIHYGAQGPMAAGIGGIEFTGTASYTQSEHVTKASCASCHMATPSGLAGGHSFNVFDEYNSKDNFNGCNATGCHTTMSATNTTFTAAVADITLKLGQLKDKINLIGAGHDILQKDPLDNLYHGYLDIYDASSNPTGWWKNPANGTPAFPALTNAQFGAIINYQLVFRGGGKGIHNYPYMSALLTNSIAAW